MLFKLGDRIEATGENDGGDNVPAGETGTIAVACSAYIRITWDRNWKPFVSGDLTRGYNCSVDTYRRFRPLTQAHDWEDLVEFV